jgi:hypothetical protein
MNPFHAAQLFQNPALVSLRPEFESFAAKANPFATCNGRMTLRYMKHKLRREPINILHWVRDARCALRHHFATKRTLRGDGNAVLVTSHL